MYVMKQRGWIEVICGSMFSGKSEELIRRVSRAQFAKQKCQVFKPQSIIDIAKKRSYHIMVHLLWQFDLGIARYFKAM